ncbi:hypothetical protein MAC_01509 [Metarhizium acridum CQMa 102]|uniref:Uncharacterized protein n=1 Tax=Metarhizium acridum (strain CQMa 102) TaxID=655827 RepID=E9DUX6_METAQ|nr:uncharacterized protein MAC_01509 [Metarhizium acridum CQMa 102]EFY92543.1 hypothetical protein MAC_01509 [Metarhizium acridum CQMa 102]
MDIEGPSSVTLTGSGSWFQWISIIRKYAVNLGIWDLIDPQQPTRTAINLPEKPKPSDVKPEAVTITDLNDAQFKRLESLQNDYRVDLQTYQRQQKALLIVQQHIIKTVGSYYDMIATEDSVLRQLQLLQGRLKPTVWEFEKRS